MAPGARFPVTFQHSGHVAYHCTIHPFMAGSLDVYAFQLNGPDGLVVAGRPAVPRGQAPGGVQAVTIEQRQPDGSWAVVATVPVAGDGSFRARLVPTRPGVYRATAAGDPSLPVALPVGARLETSVRRLKGGRVDRHSRASFVVSPPRRYAARVVLLAGHGGFGASVGPVRHVGPPGSGSRRHPMPAPRMAPRHH